MNAEKFKHIVLPLQPAMQRMARRMLGDASLAEDAVQDAVVQLWQQRDSLERVVNIEAYCITVVKRRCVDMLRRQHPTMPLDEEALMQVTPAPDETEERYRQAMSLVDRLPDRQRDVIVMKYEQGLDHKEIEQKLNMTSNHLYATLSRAYTALREMMHKQQEL